MLFRLREIATNCILTEEAHLFINEISDLLYTDKVFRTTSHSCTEEYHFLQYTTVASKKGEVFDFSVEQLIRSSVPSEVRSKACQTFEAYHMISYSSL